MDKALLAELADRFLEGTATDDEKALLHRWFDAADKEEIELVFLPERETEDDVKMRILTSLQSAIGREPQEALRQEPLHQQEPQFHQEPLLHQEHQEPREHQETGQPHEPRKPLRRIAPYTRWIAAATILVAVSATGLYFYGRRTNKAICCVQPVAEAIPGQDLKPGSNKATLLLGDGSTVNLGAVRNGVIRKVAGTLIDKQDGQLRYNVSAADMAPEMNTIQTPRGGQYQVILPDGTKVWLNAASSLTYPTAFTGGDRAVHLKGEAYFEVFEDKDKPFKVIVGNMQVKVLGTHFNVMAYDDENAIKTTLLEGAVKVTEGAASQILRPGQEARLDRSSASFKLLDVNADVAIAWKNGVFQFGGSPIETVMREIARWYDVDVEYQGRTDEHFTGTISRSVNASEVFKMLELTGAVHFNFDGKKIIVRP